METTYLSTEVLSQYVASLKTAISIPRSTNTKVIVTPPETPADQYFVVKPLGPNSESYGAGFLTHISNNACAWRSDSALTENFLETIWKIRLNVNITGKPTVQLIGRIYKSAIALPTDSQITYVTGSEFTANTIPNGVDEFNSYVSEITIPAFSLSNEYLFLILNVKINTDEETTITFQIGKNALVPATDPPPSVLKYNARITESITIGLSEMAGGQTFTPIVKESGKLQLADSISSSGINRLIDKFSVSDVLNFASLELPRLIEYVILQDALKIMTSTGYTPSLYGNGPWQKDNFGRSTGPWGRFSC